MDASHSPHVTAPEALMEVLEKVAQSAGNRHHGA